MQYIVLIKDPWSPGDLYEKKCFDNYEEAVAWSQNELKRCKELSALDFTLIEGKELIFKLDK